MSKNRSRIKTHFSEKTLSKSFEDIYNNSKHIRGAIESVLSQDYFRIEYIVIDGDSIDGTVEIVKEYKHKISFKGLRYIEQIYIVY